MPDAPTVGLALIARNEAKTLPTLLASIEGAFDQVVLLDTGSTDKTRLVFMEWAEGEIKRRKGEGFTARTDEYEWCDDFGAARRAADELLDTDWRCWADCDDEIRGAQNLRSLAANAPDHIAAFVAGYNYAEDAHGNCACYLKRERLVRAGHGEWQGRVHEAQVISGQIIEVEPQVVEWVHRKPPADKPSVRNLRILRKWLKDEPDNPRVLAYLGTEEQARNKHQKAVGYFRRYLKLKTGWDEERAQVHRKLAVSLLATGKPHDAYQAGLHALEVLPTWTDSYLTLAQASYTLGKYPDAVYWAERTLELGQPTSLLILNPLDYTVQPEVVLAAAKGAMGRVDEAIEHAERVLSVIPDHAELRTHYTAWQNTSTREAVAKTFCGSAELLIRHDEQLKALTLLEETVPHFAQDHPQVVALRSALRERLAWLRDPESYAEHYETGGSKKEDMIPDERVDEVAGNLPRARFLLEGLREQAG